VVGCACSCESMYRNFSQWGGGCRVLCEGMAPDSTADDVLGVGTNWKKREPGGRGG